jgi:hypothetical protein
MLNPKSGSRNAKVKILRKVSRYLPWSRDAFKRKAGLFRHGQPLAHLVGSLKKFAAFLRQIAPIVPVLPTSPANKSFTVNKMLAQRYLDTVEVRSSSLLVPTIPFNIRRSGDFLHTRDAPAISLYRQLWPENAVIIAPCSIIPLAGMLFE